MLNLNWSKLIPLAMDWCLRLRPWSLLLVVAGVLLVIPVMFAGTQRLREISGGPLGELCVAGGLILQALVVAAWWGPALMR